MRWLLGEKIGDTRDGSLARCSQSVNSLRTDRTSNSTYGDALLALAPTSTLASEFRPKFTNCDVRAIRRSSFVSGVHSRRLLSCFLSAGKLRYNTSRPSGDHMPGPVLPGSTFSRR